MSTSSPISSRLESFSQFGPSKANSRPGSSRISSRPGSSHNSSRPGSSRNSSRPGSTGTISRPGSTRTISRPGSTKTISRPGSTRTISRPGSSGIASRPVSVRFSSRPVSTGRELSLTDTGRSSHETREPGTDYYDYESECDVFQSGSSISDYETEEGRISRALQDWMPDYVVCGIEPRERVKREPVFSARLGTEPRIKRSPSDESIATLLSLMSCSSNGKKKQTTKRRRRRKKVENVVQSVQAVSKWVAVANRRKGALDIMMKIQSAQTIGLPQTENVIFDMLDKEEQKMVFNCGMSRGLYLAPGLKKSGSTSDVRNDVKLPRARRRRRASASETKIHGDLINFEELREQVIQRKLAQQAKQQMILARQKTKTSLRKKPRGSRGSLRRMSSSSVLSSTSASDAVINVVSEPTITVMSREGPEAKTTMWAGDHKILEIDLNREMTAKVKRKIATTARALSRVTGFGDDNGLRSTVGTLEEYPFLTDEDYGYMPKIVQRVRISPHLSRVIQQDIKVRMGRPRYHEISKQDLAMWNRGQELDRTHRNLKVFNWLHSLREDDFDSDIYPEIDDHPPDRDSRNGDIVHIRAVDEPKVKPLLERLKTEYVV